MEMHPSIVRRNTDLKFAREYLKHKMILRVRGRDKHSLLLLLVLLLPTAAMPQGYGRPYSLAATPQLLLQVSVQKKSHYFSVYDLRKMPRSVVTETDPTTNQTHVYEGVALETITTLGSQGESIEIEYGSHQTMTISGNDLDTQTKSIVADTIGGKPLPAYGPYDFVAKFRGKSVQTITGVHRIAVKTSS